MTYLKVGIVFRDDILRLWLILTVDNVHGKSPFVSFKEQAKSFWFFQALFNLGEEAAVIER